MRTWHTFPWRKSDGRAERRGRRDRAKAFLSRRTIGKRSLRSIPRDVKRGASDEKEHALRGDPLVIVERERERERGRITRDLSLHVSYPNPIRLLVDRRFTKPAKGRTATINRSKAVPPVRVDVQLDGESIW